MRQSDCPAELKILVADMLTAYDNYKQGHAALFSARTHQQIHQAARDTVENYLDNRLIWKELNHYKEKGIILGEHKIFSWLKRIDQIREMKTGDLVNLKIRLDNNIKKVKGKLRRQPSHAETLNRNENLKTMDQEISEVNRLLNL